MDIVSSCDDNFAACYAAMLHSASLYHPDARYWLLAHDLNESNRAKLEAFAASLDLRFAILGGFEAELAGVPVRDRFTAATYGRLLIPDLLPGSADRALYLDADITVTGPLDELFGIDMKGMPLAAVADLPRAADVDRRRMELPADTPYFNSGVMLFDLASWRSKRVGPRTLDFSRSYPDELLLFDQSALNVVLANQVLIVPRRWNFSDFDAWASIPDPAVVHYIRRLKPWVDARSPFTDLYRLHLSYTPFPVVPPPMRPIKHLRRIFLARLGLKRHVQYRDGIQRDAKIRDAIATPALVEARRLIEERDAGRARMSSG